MLRNVFWNWMGVGTDMALALVLTPFLINGLGDATYGIWIVIGSLTGYLGVLDFGLRSSVGRYVAYYHAQHDRDRLLATINTAAMALTGLGVISLGIVAIAARFFDRLVDVPAGLLVDSRLALMLVGLHLLVWFAGRVFDATLWGYQRFDLLNQVDVPVAMLRGLGAALVVRQGYGLVGLACVTLGVTLTATLIKAAVCHRMDGELRVSRQYFRRSALAELAGFGIWNFIGSVALMARTQLSPILISSALGIALVTPFSIIMRLLGCASVVISAAIGVLVPTATALHARNDQAQQRRMFFLTGRFCAAGALFFLALFVLLGRSLLTIWIGPRMEAAWIPLAVAAWGELFVTSVQMSENTIWGMGKVRQGALRSVAEVLTALALAAWLSSRFGLTGVCAGLSISAAFWRGFLNLLQAVRLLDVSLLNYFRGCMLPAAAGGIVPVLLLGGATWYRTPERWSELWLYGVVFSAIFTAGEALVLVGPVRLTEELRVRFRPSAVREV